MFHALPDPIPSFQLYGESPIQGLPDIVHVETFKHRSQHYEWKIAPHRHVNLFQFMWFKSPAVQVSADDIRLTTDGPSILLVPPGVVHGFGFSPDVVGTVTTMPIELIRGAVEGVGGVFERATMVTDSHPYFAYLAQFLSLLEDEYASQRIGRTTAVQSLVGIISTWIVRLDGDLSDPPLMMSRQLRPDNRIRAFYELVEENFAAQWRLAEYAAALGISKSQLSRDCRSILGAPPIQIIHDRIIKEANRKLAYTPWTIEQISSMLGFADLGYFSRFYRQRTGETPTGYRSRMQDRQL